ncbi:hypothetical protein [Actinokineospora cianjurensis]|uniref:Uncharacterized protein n=1 Tax=Actinokineospora cianjurensis TaxID=585224 RepID=A0A421B931_9PSEU|nr:hypothetical protein [Actinokineospora cianjurensis]RLK60713.1 hypothetical protein CLV68_1222 [Actinokineospora cianjurensis]
MPFFGQVWVWSLAGFLVGAVLCWLLIALPARKRVTELEGRLTAVRKREARLAAEDSGYTSAIVPGLTDTRDDLGFVQPRRTGEDSIRRGLLTLSDEDENGLRSMPAPAVDGHTDYDHQHDAGRDDEHDRVESADRHEGVDDREDAERDRDPAERDWDREPEHTAAELTQYIPPATESGTDYREEAAEYRDDSGADPREDATAEYREGTAGEYREGAAEYREGTAEYREGAGEYREGAAGEYRADGAGEYREGVEADYREGFRAAAEQDDDRDWFDRDRPDRLVDDLDETADTEAEAEYYADDDRADRADRVVGETADEHALPAAEDDRDDDTGTIFTQHTTPIPAELIRRIDAEGKADADHAPVNGTSLTDDALVDDLDDEPDLDRTGYLDPGAVARYGDHAARGDLADADAHHDSDAHHDNDGPTEYDHDEETRAAERRADDPAINTVDATQFVVPVARVEPEHVEPEPVVEVERQPAHAAVEPVGFVEQEPAPAVTDQPGFQQPIQPTPAYAEALPERNSSLLPKRIPSKPQNRFPFGVQTSTTPTVSVPAPVVAEPVAAKQTTPDRERSLFEPVLPAGDAEAAKPAPPPPNRLRGARTLQQTPSGVDPFVPPGPFGPGSAMPLPGGRSPSSEYTIKASVTALRYCAPDSAKFDRTVAEVWFRSVADAERVGFRPLG